jgi:hypothetical protein
MPDTEIKHYQCRHIFTDGHRCGSNSLRHEDFCYYHHTTRRPKPAPDLYRDTQSSFDMPLPEDRSAIQSAIGLILQRIAAGCLDSKRAGLLLYGLQIASLNLPKASAKPEAPVEEIVIDDQNRALAPIHEILPSEREKTLEEFVMEHWYKEEPARCLACAALLRPLEMVSTPPDAPSIAPVSHAISGSAAEPAPSAFVLRTLQATTSTGSTSGKAHEPSRHHTFGEKSVNSRNVLSTCSTSLPSASLAALTAFHSGSLANAFQRIVASSRLGYLMT